MRRSGIETSVDGLLVRSRLEARWLRFLTLLEWPIEYEPIDLNGYIPDFVIMGRRSLLVEVKPAFTYAECVDLALLKSVGATRSCGRELLVVGASPFLEGDLQSEDRWEHSIAGVIFQRCDSPDGYSLSPDPARFVRCIVCDSIGVMQMAGSWDCYPCGHHGKHYLRGVDKDDLQPLWTTARNSTRWKPAA